MIEHVQLRPAVGADLPAIAAVTAAAYTAYAGQLDPPASALTETLEAIGKTLTKGGIIVAEAGAEIVGAARYRPADDHVWLFRVAVRPEWQRQGIGRRLVRAVEEWSELLGFDVVRLGVRPELRGNRELYERLGYRMVATVPFERKPERSYLLMEHCLS